MKHYTHTFNSNDGWDSGIETIYQSIEDKFIIKFKNKDALYEFHGTRKSSTSSGREVYTLTDYISGVHFTEEYTLYIDHSKNISLIKTSTSFDFGNIKSIEDITMDYNKLPPYQDILFSVKCDEFIMIMLYKPLDKNKDRILYVGETLDALKNVEYYNYKTYRDGGTTTFDFRYNDKEYHFYKPSSFLKDEHCKLNDDICFYNTKDINDKLFNEYGEQYNIKRIKRNSN